MPGALSTTPRRSIGQPSSPITGGSTQEKSCRKPVHQTTFATSSTRSSASTGRPSRTPTVRAGAISTPTRARSSFFTLISGPPWARISGRILRPSGLRSVSRCRATKKSTGNATFATGRSRRKGIWPWMGPLKTTG
jgi:hypothetical protein